MAGLFPDFAVSNILESTALDSPCVSCTGCKSKELSAIGRCFDCANFLCANCVMAHQFMHCFEGHRVLTLGELQSAKDDVKMEKPVPCSKHRSELLRFFCKTCNIPICKDCTLMEHSKGHEYDYLSEIGAQVVDNLCQLAEQAKVKANDLRGSSKSLEHSANRLQIQYQKAQNEINETYNFYRSMLEDRKQDLLKELDAAFRNKQQTIATTGNRTQEAIEKLYQSCEFIDKIHKHASNTEIVMFKKSLDARLHGIMAYTPDISYSNGFDVEFVSNYQAIQAAVRNTFGYIRQSPDIRQSQPQPIARPNGISQRPMSNGPVPNSTLPSIMSNPMSNGLAAVPPNSYCNSIANGIANGIVSGLPNGNIFEPDSFLQQSKQQFPSNGSLNIAQPSDLLGPNPYEKWSNGGLDILHGGDVFSTSADPIVDITSKLITANIYPPKSQIKRQKMIYHCKFGEFGVMEGQFTEPSGVAVNAQNDIIVADTNNHRIQIFDKEGRFKFQFGECGKRDGQLLYPNRVAVVKSSGDIIVTERSPTHQVRTPNRSRRLSLLNCFCSRCGFGKDMFRRLKCILLGQKLGQKKTSLPFGLERPAQTNKIAVVSCSLESSCCCRCRSITNMASSCASLVRTFCSTHAE